MRENDYAPNQHRLHPFTFVSYSVASDRHPQRNEDALIVDEAIGLAAVFDGVGGSIAGEIASHIAAQVLHAGWKQVLAENKVFSLSELSEKLLSLIEMAHQQIRTQGANTVEQRGGIEAQATTIAVAAFCRQDGASAYTMIYATVGDSRIYLLREPQPLLCLTRDDSILSKLVQDNTITEEAALHIDQATAPSELSEIEQIYFNKRNGISQALGDAQSLNVHLAQTTIMPGDRVVLCSDGIHDNLTNRQIEEVLKSTALPLTARALVEQALLCSRQEGSMRAKPDDITAIVAACA